MGNVEVNTVRPPVAFDISVGECAQRPPAAAPCGSPHRQRRRSTPMLRPGGARSPPRDEPRPPWTTDLATALLHPATTAHLSAPELGRLGLLCTLFRRLVLDPHCGDPQWRAMCRAAARDFGIGSGELCGYGAAKKYFLSTLWPTAQAKWSRKEAVGSFKIQVGVRFRPAEQRGGGALLVPLHQRLHLLKGGEKLREVDPPHFRCDLLGALMVDPVRLPSSSKVVERAVIVVQLRSRPVDPFDGTPLAAHMVLPCEALKGEIAAWRAGSGARMAHEGYKLQEEQMDALVSKFGGVSPELLDMLREAERVRRAAHRALADAAEPCAPSTYCSDPAEAAPAPAHAAAPVPVPGGVPAAAAAELARLGGLEEDLYREAENAGDAPAEVQSARPAARPRDAPRLLALRPRQVIMFQPGAGVRPFIFERCFDGRTGQQAVYEDCARGALEHCLNGFNSCLICYGQTGSGKTHTMFGPPGALSEEAPAPGTDAGVALRTLFDLCEAAQLHCGGREVSTTVTMQYVQIYQDKLTCLLSGAPVTLRCTPQGLFEPQGAAGRRLTSYASALQLLREAEQRKVYAQTAMNQRSSRAHTMLLFEVSQCHKGRDQLLTTRLCLADLAGSERVKKSRAVGDRLLEAVGINFSLTALGRTIAALVEERSHVPYYESRLTMLLKAALGGDARTQVLVCCQGDPSQGEETLQSLRFGERCAMVTNTTLDNVESAAGALQEVDRALAQARRQLRSLAARGKENLPAYRRLEERRNELLDRRDRLRVTAGGYGSGSDDGASETER